MRKFLIILLLLVCSFPCTADASQIAPAFPGAEGFGKYAKGGRGGQIYYVTNLNDSGPGSLREAVSEPYRTVLFKVSGTIELESTIDEWASYITIAGQTAPGDGICIKNYGLSILNTHDIIIRYIRIRVGDKQGMEPATLDSLNIINSNDVIIDHCSFSWSNDEVLSTWGTGDNITVQWCILSEPLMPHAGGSALKFFKEDGYSTFHHNLYAHCNYRTPRVEGFGVDGNRHFCDWYNNVIYDWGYRSSHSSGNTSLNYINNYLLAGPNTLPDAYWQAFEGWNSTIRLYFPSGNYVNDQAVTSDTPDVILGSPDIVSSAFETPYRVPDDAPTAYQDVLDNAGATLPKRDSVDTRIVNEVINRTGEIIYSQSEVGGWPTYNSSSPPQDSDGDGMPDWWEIEHGLGHHDASDGNMDPDGDGYTNLDEYLNDTDPFENDTDIVFVEDDFEDGDYTNDPNWAFAGGNGQIIQNTPGTTDGNHWLEVGTGPTVAAVETDFETELVEAVEVSGKVLWRSSEDNETNWAAFYIFNSDGQGGINTSEYIQFRINFAGSDNNEIACYVRGAGNAYISPNTSPVNEVNKWYDVRCLYNNTTKNFQIWIDGQKYLDYNHPDYNGYLNKPARLRLYSRHGYVHGFDNPKSSLPQQKCGDPGTVYLEGDLNKDCEVDIDDLSIFGSDWSKCSDPQDETCGDYYKPPVYETIVTDDFEDGNYTANPPWTCSSNAYGNTCKIIEETDNKYLNLLGSHTRVITPTGSMNNLDYGRRLTTDLIIEGKLKFLQFSESSYAAVYLISEDSQTYVKYILSMDQAEQDCWVYVYREHVGTTFKSTQTKSGITTVDVWYPFKLVFTTNNHFEIWVNSGSGMELILREKDRIRVGPTIQDFDNLRLYTRGVEVGFDDILLKAESLPYCGISGTYYFPADINQDCRVDFEDFAEIVQNWLECTSPLNQNCRPYSN